MPVAASDPPFSNYGRQMGKITDPMQKGYYNFCGAETWTPSVNLYENDTAYMVCVDLAGVVKEEIDLEVVENQLTVKGRREVPAMPTKQQNEPRVRVHLMEIDHGSFCRVVELPEDIQREAINASYREGLLWIEIPKR
jgi:HSP20 family protein